jgi:hypothetical protein
MARTIALALTHRANFADLPRAALVIGCALALILARHPLPF